MVKLQQKRDWNAPIIFLVFKANNITAKWQTTNNVLLINWRDTTHFDSEDDYHTGCQTVSHWQQQSYSGLHSPGQPYSTYL